jgi:hypothetical protein
VGGERVMLSSVFQWVERALMKPLWILLVSKCVFWTAIGFLAWWDLGLTERFILWGLFVASEADSILKYLKHHTS